ncbi:N-acetylmuramoyl-L-alanine amidase [Bacteroidia bacterium]|nr:N-acetylmuramoyl-L-alanine amidase [Bacteroidia bacterium]
MKTKYIIIISFICTCCVARYFLLNEIVIHCTATPEGTEYTLNQIDQWHKARGFGTIGYNYIIHLDGQIEKGRSLWLPGAHCNQKGKNFTSIGICYIGGCAKNGKTPKDTRTNAQKQVMSKLIKELKNKYPIHSINGHRNYAQKACPSFDVSTLKREMNL